MQLTADAFDFAPPRQGRWRGPLLLALVAHAMLVAALTWGIGWKRDADPVTVAAELWSALPVEAAPRGAAPAAEPEPEPAPPAPEPRPAPPTPPQAAPVPQGPTDAQIALKKKAEEKKRQDELEQKRLAEQKKKEEARREEERREAARKDDLRKKREAEQRAEDKKKREAQEARDKAQKEKADKAEERRRELQREADRKAQLARMMGQAGGNGGGTGSGSGNGAPGSRGTAAQASGPSANYGGRVVARIKPNIVFTDAISGNPRAVVEVRATPDGTILGSKLLQSSGNKAWDDAVQRAVERTTKLPKDDNGRVPTTMEIGFRPHD